MSHARRAVANSAAGIGLPSTRRTKRHPVEAWRFFLARASSGRRVFMLFTVDGAREPQGSPVLVQVVQPCIVRHLAIGLALADSSTQGTQAMNTSDEASSRSNRIRHLDELENRLSSLLHEVRLIANLSDVQPPQLLDIDSRGLTALLERIATDLQSVQDAVARVVARQHES